MDDKLTEYRCPKCPKRAARTLQPALLFKASGTAVIETKCPRCGNRVVIDVQSPESYEDAMRMVKAND